MRKILKGKNNRLNQRLRLISISTPAIYQTADDVGSDRKSLLYRLGRKCADQFVRCLLLFN